MKNRLSVFASLCALFALLTASSQAVESARYGLRLCAELILPALFPFFVVARMLIALDLPRRLGRMISGPARRLFGVSGEGASALLLGLTGGYPLGADYTAQLLREGLISVGEAEHLLAFCNNSGPAFLVGAVGIGIFGSARLGLLLYSIHVLSALLIGLLMRDRSGTPAGPPPEPGGRRTLPEVFPEAVQGAVLASLSVCGFVVCFSVFTGLLDANGLLSLLSGWLSAALGTPLHWSRALLCGLLELGGGIGAMRGLSVSPLSLGLAAGLVGWGGVSVQFQSLALLSDLEIKSAPLLTGRLLSGIFGFLLAYALGLLL